MITWMILLINELILFTGYMEFELDNAISILVRTPLILKVFLNDLSTEWTDPNEGDNTWSPFDVIGHLIHGEKTDWIIRAKIILVEGPKKEFESFDRFAQFKNSKGKTLNQLLDEFEMLRVQNLEQLRSMNISIKDLSLEGSHPQFGKVLISVHRDITERKQAETELQHHKENLEKLVNERTKELEKKNAELERFNRLFVGREFRIKELKDKLKKYEGQGKTE